MSTMGLSRLTVNKPPRQQPVCVWCAPPTSHTSHSHQWPPTATTINQQEVRSPWFKVYWGEVVLDVWKPPQRSIQSVDKVLCEWWDWASRLHLWCVSLHPELKRSFWPLRPGTHSARANEQVLCHRVSFCLKSEFDISSEMVPSSTGRSARVWDTLTLWNLRWPSESTFCVGKDAKTGLEFVAK